MRFEYEDEDPPVSEEEERLRKDLNLGVTITEPERTPTPLDDETEQRLLELDPGNRILLEHLSPQYVQVHEGQAARGQTVDPSLTSVLAINTSMGPVSIPPILAATPDGDVAHINKELAAAALIETEQADGLAGAGRRTQKDRSPPPNPRVDSAQSAEEQSPKRPPPQVLPKSPLKLQTSSSDPGPRLRSEGQSDTILTSPTIGRHVMSASEDRELILPPVKPGSPAQERRLSGSPNKLPSFQHLAGQVGQLTDLADAAETQRGTPHLAHSRPNSMSYMPTHAPSPRLPFHSYPGGPQMSPITQSHPYFANATRSPTGTLSDMHIPGYGSPTQYPAPLAYYGHQRRSSAATDPTYSIPSVPSMPSGSSGESQGLPGSSTEGYNAAHAAPVDPGPMIEGQTPRHIPILPPPRGMPPAAAIPIAGGFKCDEPGCTAPPFQTQYLLRYAATLTNLRTTYWLTHADSSHKNVHSSTRPYFCPVKDCPRSEGGKGFKRKNEMIRHGLVHNSPGYVCPFCPDREHRYPRPDNLQR